MPIPLHDSPILNKTLSEFVQTQAPRLPPEATVRQALDLMRRTRNGCVIVGRGDRPEGVFTERDVLKRLAAGRLRAEAPLEEVMSAPPVCISASDTVFDAMRRMHQHGLRHLVALDPQGRCAGLISIRNLTDALAESYPQSILNLPPRLNQQARHPEGA